MMLILCTQDRTATKRWFSMCTRIGIKATFNRTWTLTLSKTQDKKWPSNGTRWGTHIQTCPVWSLCCISTNHHILLQRLAALKAGLTPFIRQISHVNNEFSVYTLVSHGVSQGSVLGPIILTVCTLPYGNIWKHRRQLQPSRIYKPERLTCLCHEILANWNYCAGPQTSNKCII